MIFQRIDLDTEHGVYMNAYLHEPSQQENSCRPAVVVCPGGGYHCCAPHEADPIALQYLAAGYHAFVVYYSLGERAAFPQPLLDLSRAMKIIRGSCEDWNLNPNQIAVCGFSAGGHLTASLGTMWNHPEIAERSACELGENRPNALILAYPVITPYSWMRPALPRLIGDRDREETERLLDCSRNVGPHTPPSFLVHTFMDNAVSVEESLDFANALERQDIPFELHIFPDGPHGMGLGDPKAYPSFARWMELSVLWLNRLFGEKEKKNPSNRAKQTRDC